MPGVELAVRHRGLHVSDTRLAVENRRMAMVLLAAELTMVAVLPAPGMTAGVTRATLPIAGLATDGCTGTMAPPSVVHTAVAVRALRAELICRV